MGLFKKKKQQAIEAKSTTGTTKKKAYDKREKVQALSAIITIVNRGQIAYYIDAYQEAGAAMSMDLYGYSMPPEEYRHIMGVDTTKKEILITITRAEYIEKLLKIAEDRFAISAQTKGIAFACPIDAVSGIQVYKFLADQNKKTRENGNGNNQ